MKKRSSKLPFMVFGITGVLFLALGALSPGLAEEFQNGTVAANVNLRKAPSLQGKVVSGLLRGTAVKIYAKQDGWYRVSAKKYHQVFNGWVSTQFVDIAAGQAPLTPPVVEEPAAGEPRPSPAPAKASVQPEPIAMPAKPLPAPVTQVPLPEVSAPAVAPEPEPEKRAPAKPPETKLAVPKPRPETKRPSPGAKAPVTDAAAEPADDLKYLIPMALPVLAVIVLLIAVIVYRVRRASGPKAEQPDLPAEPSPVEWPQPDVENEHALEESRLSEENLSQFEEDLGHLEEGDLSRREEEAPGQREEEGSGRLVEEDIDRPEEDSGQPVEEDLNRPGTEALKVEFDFKMEPTSAELNADDDSDRPAKGVSVYDMVIKKINRMSELELVGLLNRIDDQSEKKPRKDDRLNFYTTIDYVVDGQYYRDFVQDLSISGVFIKTRQMFEPGQHILMTFMSPFLQKPFKISGEIVRTLDTGIGVNFDKESQVQTEAISALMEQIRMVEDAG